MAVRHWIAGAAMAFAISAQAVTDRGVVLNNSTLGLFDNSVATIVGTHVAGSGIFQDFFAFGVSAPAVAVAGLVPNIFGADVPASAYAVPVAIALFDINSNVLALDNDGSDGFLVAAGLPSTGVYLLGVFGVTGDGVGAYGGQLVTLPVSAVPELGSAPLLFGGLLGLAGAACRRRRAGVGQNPPAA